jgi:predicted transcriptional regulator
MTFGDKVRYARERMGNISTTQLAKMLGIEQPNVSKVENSPTRRFAQKITLKLSQVSGLPLEFFMNDNIKTPAEVAPAHMVKELEQHYKFIRVADAAVKAGLTEQDVLDLIEVAKKLKRGK